MIPLPKPHGRFPRKHWPRISYFTSGCFVTTNGDVVPLFRVDQEPGLVILNRKAAHRLARRERILHPESDVKVWACHKMIDENRNQGNPYKKESV